MDAGVRDTPRDAAIDAATVVCIPIDTADAPDGHHNAGQSCLSVGCHVVGATGAGANPFLLGGTLYDDMGNALTGATIIVSPSSGSPIKVLSGGGAAPGNFYALNVGGFQIGGATASASGCPNIAAMQAALQAAGGGNCNNCHRPGGLTTPIQLP